MMMLLLKSTTTGTCLRSAKRSCIQNESCPEHEELKELLSVSKTKKDLTCIFAKALLQHFSQRPSFKLVVVYDAKIEGQNFEEEHSHEEADTLIPHQVLASVTDKPWREVFVWSPDTDVFILLLHLASSQQSNSSEASDWQRRKIQGSRYVRACECPGTLEIPRPHRTAQLTVGSLLASPIIHR